MITYPILKSIDNCYTYSVEFFNGKWGIYSYDSNAGMSSNTIDMRNWEQLNNFISGIQAYKFMKENLAYII